MEEGFRLLSQIFGYQKGSPMLFNSGQFLGLFIVFFAFYLVIQKKINFRLIWSILFSFLFYYKASGWYLFILLLSIVVDYFVALWMDKAQKKSVKKTLLVFSILINVGLLFYFKYTNFFIDNINQVAGQKIPLLDIFLPIGISFYTFQTLSYVIDVYKGILKPMTNFLDYAFYMSFFPHLVAGPIVRAKDFLPQVRQELSFDPDRVYEGFYLVCKGLIKKVIFADFMAQYADIVYSNPEGYSGFEHLIAMYAYTLQIYCDFSGYSDMAIGIAKWMGYDLGVNFRTPYQSKNITEFWRRWHISLSSWLRDYIYIPLGGSRKGIIKTYLFLMTTMLIGGFWHGADWKFILWGGVHGIALATHKFWLSKTENISFFKNNKIWNIFSALLTFHLVAFLWIYFRANSFSDANYSIYAIFNRMDLNFIQPFLNVRGLFLILLIVGYITHFIPDKIKLMAQKTIGDSPFYVKTIILLIIIQLMLQFQSESVQPFIYFQF